MSVRCITVGLVPSAPGTDQVINSLVSDPWGRDLPRRADDRVKTCLDWRKPGVIDRLGKRLRKRLPPPLE
jgi:hypothetical protein